MPLRSVPPCRAFVNRPDRTAEVADGPEWVVDEHPTFLHPLAGPVGEESVWAIAVPVHASRQTMLWVDVYFECDPATHAGGVPGYQSSFVVEWSGWNTLNFTVSSLTKIGDPAGLPAVTTLRLVARTATFGGTRLRLGSVGWLHDSPLVEVTPGEDLVVNFLHERMWDRRDWVYSGNGSLPGDEQALAVAWMYAHLSYRQRPGRWHQTAYTRKMNVDLSRYQALTVWTATDVRANFSVVLEIDGQTVRAIDRRRGLGGGDEMRALLSGRHLTALTFELEQAEAEIVDPIAVTVASSIRWVLLERHGFDPATAGQVHGMPPVLGPVRVGELESEILPVGLLIGREEFLRLRDQTREPGPLKTMADEIIAEATAHESYAPERYVGRYLPVDLGNQGCERRVSPCDQMYHLNSSMVYGALAYALTGEVRHAQTARRGLFATLNCTAWQAGLPSRIPCGLPGYRAPFIEAATADCVAQCYDFIYPLLAESERREVEDALYLKALPWIDMYLRYHGEGYLLKSNQGAVYVAGLVSAALVARRSHPDVDVILDRAIAWFPRMMNNYYLPSGATNEGPGYWEFTTQHAAAALVSICRHKAWRVQDYAPTHFGETMTYLMHLRSLARERLSFLPLSDNIEGAGYSFMSSSFMFFARYYGDANALWLWHEYFGGVANPPGSAFFGKRMTGACSLSGLMNLLFYVPGAPPTPSLPMARHFPDCDRIFLRTGCRHGDMLAFFEGGPQTFEHTHADKGSFMVEAYGERFAADPGVVKYQDPSAINFKNTTHHNLVTWQGCNQEYRDAARAVVLHQVQFGDTVDLIAADLGNSYRTFKRYRRHFLFVRPHYFLVLDDLDAGQPGWEWNFHSGVPIVDLQLESGLIRWESAKAGMLMALGSPDRLQAATGVYQTDGVVLTHNLVLTSRDPKPTLQLAALLLPFPLGPAIESAAPSVEVRAGSAGVDFVVRGAWGTDQVSCDFDAGVAGPAVRVSRDDAGGCRTIYPPHA
ncbi:MAG: hypothetical protein RIS54_918 [Verrucomicrobiota bacterium]|jgi:hypothetical protein